MPTVHISSYRLRQDKLEEYLKEIFPTTKVDITVRLPLPALANNNA